MKISVIIPVYNEEKVIGACLESLSKQTLPIEIIVVNDGSTDRSEAIIQNTKYEISRSSGIHNAVNAHSSQTASGQNTKYLIQKHLGPGAARNLGAKQATGKILVFIDSDMTFAPDFIAKLTEPIVQGKAKGTFSKKEYVANWDNIWARCWNYNQNIANHLRVPENYPQTAPVFRAILRSEFIKVGGFDEGIGWTDDWSLSRKLGYQSNATNAVYYHKNPDTLKEVFTQAKWVGKNEYISGKLLKLIINFLYYSLPVSLIIGLIKAVKYQTKEFIAFKIIYDLGISFGLIEVLAGKNKNK